MANRHGPWWRRLTARLFGRRPAPAPSIAPAPTPEPEAEEEGAERRTAPRYKCNLGTACKPAMYADKEFWPGRIKDISAGGLGLLVKRRFEPGTLLRVDVSRSIPDAPPTLWVCVVRLVPQAGGEWLLGCTQVRPLEHEELDAFLHDPEKVCTVVHEMEGASS